MAAAAASGLGVVALTDHDTAAGWAEASDAARRLGIGLVPGAELSCRSGGVSVHLLCYLHDPADPALAEQAELTRDDRAWRARRIVERIAEDFPLTWADVEEQLSRAGAAEATVGRPHIADAMVARGLVPDRDEAFARVLHDGSPYFVAHYAPEVEHAVRLARAAGGVPVIAHARADRRGAPVVDDAVLASMAAAGMLGIEVDHPAHDDDARAHLRSLAADLGLLTTGSSDHHGTGSMNRLGVCTTTPQTLEAILALGTGTAAVLP